MSEVVVAQVLAGHLGDAVHGGRLEDRALGRVDEGGGGSEHRDGARPEDLAHLELDGEIEDVLETADVDAPGPLRVLLAVGGEKRREVIDGADVVAPDECPQCRLVGGVEGHEGAGVPE